MAIRYISIKSKDDIDTTKITLGAINNRYVDPEGRRYATRFNMRTRKVDIVQIAVGSDEVLALREKKEEAVGSASVEQEVPEHRIAKPDWVISEGISADTNINIESYVLSIEGESAKFSERLRGIVANVKKSEVFEDATGASGKDLILELTGFFDHEVQDQLNDAQNLVIEFQRFPKPPSHYYIHLDRKQKIAVEHLDEIQQMAYFRAYLVGTHYLNALSAGLELIATIKEQAQKAQTQNLPRERKTFYDNAFEACDFVVESIRNETAKLLGWLEIAKVF